jgi:hypothetical protein
LDVGGLNGRQDIFSLCHGLLTGLSVVWTTSPEVGQVGTASSLWMDDGWRMIVTYDCGRRPSMARLEKPVRFRWKVNGRVAASERPMRHHPLCYPARYPGSEFASRISGPATGVWSRSSERG